jgi:hypothetical protein
MEDMAVDFSLSAFLRLEDGGEIVPYHTGISAVLLVAIMPDKSRVCGALHPAATYPFDGRLLWQDPFVYSKDWPIQGRRVRCAGTLGNQFTHEVPHAPIRIEGR